jgi:predicted dehydrogenase
VIRAAIAGLGWWGRRLIEAVAAKGEGLQFALAVEPNAAAAEPARAHGIPVVARLEEALSDRAIQAVVLTTPHSLHEAQIVAAAQAGKHVFCEKPLCMTRRGAERAIEACRRAGVVLAVGHERRFEPPVRELHRMLAAGELGTPLCSEGNFSQDFFVGLPRDNWRFSAKEAPAASLTGPGIHVLDLSVSVFGMPERVTAECGRVATDMPQGDTLSVLLGFAGGASATVNSMLATPFVSRFALYGSKGWAEIVDKDHPQSPAGWVLRVCRAGGKPEVRDYPVADPVLANLEAFALAVSGGAAYPVPAEQLLATVTGFECIVRSVAERRTIRPEEL